MEQLRTGWSINLGGSPIDPFCPTLVALSGDLLSLAPDDPPPPVMLPQLPTDRIRGLFTSQKVVSETVLCLNLQICSGKYLELHSRAT